MAAHCDDAQAAHAVFFDLRAHARHVQAQKRRRGLGFLGAAERTAMRFPIGTVVPLQLNDAQRDEALALLYGVSEEWGVAA